MQDDWPVSHDVDLTETARLAPSFTFQDSSETSPADVLSPANAKEDLALHAAHDADEDEIAILDDDDDDDTTWAWLEDDKDATVPPLTKSSAPDSPKSPLPSLTLPLTPLTPATADPLDHTYIITPLPCPEQLHDLDPSSKQHAQLTSPPTADHEPSAQTVMCPDAAMDLPTPVLSSPPPHALSTVPAHADQDGQTRKRPCSPAYDVDTSRKRLKNTTFTCPANANPSPPSTDPPAGPASPTNPNPVLLSA
ncbi:hypothetical protein DM01DRAFT_1333980 [Hesseltinella vesiculosa]|uniref:Uncharacterized protein n=1 Tax=Hesseltinella vesiculosa TaxID=101127 RepID=A0A1X2GPI7_9FUNG|nr:hypothetical protein DM01DRAFT_1333980 [Hesseltinella vesiculosa]